jgi:hypothetical protein
VLRIPAETAARAVDSCSIVLGAFGDVVRFANGDVFLSWYPVGRRAMTTSIRPPTGWQAPPSPGETAEIASVTLRALRELVPALDPLAAIAVGPSMIHSGVIYARGTSDIHDPRSGYHERYAIGPRSLGRYHSIDTGKYTTAPLFACHIADRIAGPRRTLMTFGAATPRTGATPPAANTPWVAGPPT